MAVGTIADLKEVTKVLAYAHSTADHGLTFKSGVLDWNNLVSAVVTDASHANEVEKLQHGRVEAHRSQGARLQLLATPKIAERHGVRISFDAGLGVFIVNNSGLLVGISIGLAFNPKRSHCASEE